MIPLAEMKVMLPAKHIWFRRRHGIHPGQGIRAEGHRSDWRWSLGVRQWSRREQQRSGGFGAGDGAGVEDDASRESVGDVSLIDERGVTVAGRIRPPEGFERLKPESGSFGEFLQNLPLKPHGTRVRYYDGNVKPWDVHAAVIDLDVGERDLQQCADAVIRLRAEYLYSKGLYDQIHFNFTNGFNAEYKKWMEGYRIRVSGNDARWVKQKDRDTGYGCFREYLDGVYICRYTVPVRGNRVISRTEAK